MSQGFLRILIAGACLAFVGCGSSTDKQIEPPQVIAAFASQGLTLERSPVPGTRDALDYVHYPEVGSSNDLVVTVFDTEDAAISYEQAAEPELPPDVGVRYVERVHNVVLVINKTATIDVEETAREAMSSLE